ncbi:uncharacterized protein J7T54_007922 [Emericellopsis cladophorae]|uniref:Uncharacterized protein n=1 Tax=Emericellopsis cladophorae TaxID=2686198 RepID=A0A9P9Y8P2_9HYPO|nr:uncharacterized protein J7T54_007922 [Emericellopsis cladophorae]KAI6784829.1 hypothetical protein J7T54_007922 [Emericellopsis cladophorae]
MLDDTKTLRGIVVTWTLRFNDVLDADKLHSSLSELLEIGDWRKMGGRMRMNESGALEIHAPRSFTAERPAVAYSQETLAVNIEKHELARALPKATDNDFIYHDVPQLSLHITLFNDATLVPLSWPHTLMDVMGQQGLLRGWSMVLAGRVSDVPPVLGAREDAIRAAVDAPVEAKENFKVGQKALKGCGFAAFGLRFAWDMMRDPVPESRTIFLPSRTVAELRRQAENDLVLGADDEKPFVNNGDLPAAWVARALTSSLPQPRPVTVLHALNARFRLSSLVNSAGVYIQNMAVAASAFLPEDSHTKLLGHVALENRQHLMEQATEGQVLAFARELQQNTKTGGDPNILCGPSDAVLLPFTNWERANIFNAKDFSPAVVHADRGGNYWLNGILLPSTWLKIREEIERMRGAYHDQLVSQAAKKIVRARMMAEKFLQHLHLVSASAIL